jgi:BRCT domain type II-containing protein
MQILLRLRGIYIRARFKDIATHRIVDVGGDDPGGSGTEQPVSVERHEAVKKHRLKTLSEDEFLDLIATRKCLDEGGLDDKAKKKLQKEQEDIFKAAKEMEKREKTHPLKLMWTPQCNYRQRDMLLNR